MNEVTILSFNVDNIKNYSNGPGMCLLNFVNILQEHNIRVNLFSKLPTKNPFVMKLDDSVLSCLRKSDLVIQWSGLDPNIKRYVLIANKMKIPVILGPNLIDGVAIEKEKQYLDRIKYSAILVVNPKIKDSVIKKHNINEDKIFDFMIGPDLKLWTPCQEKDNTILWKGNSKQYVKDIDFALELEKQLPQYKFKFIGYPQPYNYYEHIDEARKSKIQIVTSISETMGLAGLEGLASGLPLISHPKVFISGVNNETGIITSKNINSFKKAIIKIMEDEQLYLYMSKNATSYVQDNFSNNKIYEKFLNILKRL